MLGCPRLDPLTQSSDLGLVEDALAADLAHRGPRLHLHPPDLDDLAIRQGLQGAKHLVVRE